MKEYRLVINLNDTSITTKQVGEDGLFKIRKIDGFRAYPCESKSDVQEYFEKLKADCFNVTNFTKDTFNVILLSECSNQEIVDAVKDEIQDTTFTILDNTFSKAFNSEDNNSEDLDELSQKNRAISTEKDALSTKIEKLETEKDNLSKEIAELQKSNKESLDKVSELESRLSNYNMFGSIVGYNIQFGRDSNDTALSWWVYDSDDNCISLILAQGISCFIISSSSKNLDNDVSEYLNEVFLKHFSKNEIELIQGIDRSIDKKVELPSEIDFKNKILPNLKNETHRNKSNLLLVEKHTNIFFNKLGGNFYLLKNKRIFQAEKSSIVNLDTYLKNDVIRRHSFLISNRDNHFQKLEVHPVIKVRLK